MSTQMLSTRRTQTLVRLKIFICFGLFIGLPGVLLAQALLSQPYWWVLQYHIVFWMCAGRLVLEASNHFRSFLVILVNWAVLVIMSIISSDTSGLALSFTDLILFAFAAMIYFQMIDPEQSVSSKT